MKKVLLIVVVLIIQNTLFAQQLVDLESLIIDNKFEKAVKLGEKLYSENVQDPELYYIIAYAYKKLNRFKSAEDYCKKAYLTDSLNVKYTLAYANILVNNEQYRKAINLYQSVLNNYPDKKAALRNLSGIYIKLKKYNKALLYFKTLSKIDSLNSYNYRMLGTCYFNLNNKDSALEMLSRAYEIDSVNRINIKQLASLYFNRKEFNKCLMYTSKGIKLDSLYSEFYRLSGKANFHINNFKESKDLFRKVIELGDSTKEINLYLGKTFYRLKDYQNALLNMKAAYEEDTANASLCQYLGKIYFELNEHTKSIRYNKKALELLEPSSTTMAILNRDLSISYYQRGEYSLALNNYQKKLNYSSKSETYKGKTSFDYFFLANIYDKLGLYKKALKNFKTYTKLIDSQSNKIKEQERYDYSKYRITRIMEELHIQGKSVLDK